MINKLKELLLKNKTIRQTIFKNIFWLTVGQIFTRIIRALLIIYAARVLGNEGFGIFNYALTIGAFLSIFSDFGINSVLIREISRDHEKENIYFGTVFIFKIFLLLITALFITFVGPLLVKIESIKELMKFISLLIIFDVLRDLITSYFRAKEKMEIEALIVGTTNLSILIFGIFTLQISPSPKSLTISYILSSGLGTLVGLLLNLKKLKKAFVSFKKEIILPLLKVAFPIGFNSTLGSIMAQSDILMLGYLKTVSDVGFYSASQRIVVLLYLLPSIIVGSLFPVISRFAKKNNHHARILIENGLALLILIALPITFGGIILGNEIVNFIFGEKYFLSGEIFKILIINVLFVFPGSLIGVYLLAYEKQKKIMLFSLSGGILNIFLNFFLISFYGMKGAALATLISQMFVNLTLWQVAKKTNYFQVLPYLKKIFLSLIIMILVCLTLKNAGISLILNIIISGTIYFLTLFGLKEPILKQIIEIIKTHK